MPDPKEPEITVNGLRLNYARALTLRVAAMQFEMWLEDEENRKALGPVGDSYLARIREVITMMVEPLARGEGILP